VIFNRSHYEDIIAVRVKKLFPDEVWERRQRHVVDFERMLAEEGTTIVKIFLHISKDEQKRRLESRLENPSKHWKFNPDDLADRALWDDFMTAYQDVITNTSTGFAPWFVVPADRKWYRNLCVARIMLDTMKKLDMQLPKIDWDPSGVKIGD
jgi:polyphosphate kinase 2 (PPK2 family)